MDKKIIGIIAAVVVIGGAVIFWGIKSGQEDSAPAATLTGTIYFYGAECPHCKVINEFIESNKIAEKFSFVKKEVWHDKTNQQEMSQAAKQCGLDVKKIGVPFVFDNGQCLIGEPDVKKFFGEKGGVK
jgi:glutaredoxin